MLLWFPPKNIPVGGQSTLINIPFGVSKSAHSALQWTGIPSGVYSHLAPGVPRIDSGSTVTLSRIMHPISISVSISCELLSFTGVTAQTLTPDAYIFTHTYVYVCQKSFLLTCVHTRTNARTCVRNLFKPIRSQQCDENETQVELEVLLIFEMVGWGCLMCIPHTHTHFINAFQWS